ncbi:MAG: tetratricopeptide repeat protein [Sandaracinaceae bacterium]
MHTKLNAVLLGSLVAVGGALELHEPAPATELDAGELSDLARLEDRVALDPDDRGATLALADRYLAVGQPRLAIAILGAAPAELREDPDTLHRLARAYEETGRMEDALATGELALARCARALGTEGASSLTPVPERSCSERSLANLDMHARALEAMVRWGVTDVSHDLRAAEAYRRAIRSARILSASAE